MTLGQKQRKFTEMIGRLIAWAYENGYELSFGDAWASTGHIDGSYHYKRLAVDFNLFIDGVYQTTTEAHKPLGDHWKMIGGTWGGDFARKDGNHYSYDE
ncbi:MAG: M15 family metallopeptidase [Gammaproteobacteria bacterium]|nr:M15 family metallopeptidase [Gammaproteobacteria bacterium]